MRLIHALAGFTLVSGSLAGQQPISRADARDAALLRGARSALARADTQAAAGLLHGARLYPNPSLGATYTKDTPHYHVIADVPLDLPWLRSARVGAASAASDAARFRFSFERAAIRFDVDTTYTHALAAQAHAQLSRRTAQAADTLLAMARLRRSVGDVSELDVRLAEVNAGQMANAAADDSLASIATLLAVQLAMGLAADSQAIVLADTLVPPPDSALPGVAGEPLRVAAAVAELRAEERTLSLAHRNAFPTPSFQVGVEFGDPTQSGSLPTFGLALPIPLFHRNGGEVAQARAARERARAELDLAIRAQNAELQSAQRVLAVARTRLTRDRTLLAGTDQVAAMSLQAYREGAVPLANVLEAQRLAREALGRYVDDIAAANDAADLLRLVTAVSAQ
ncbi:MAG TPA: TolC family protein [Gemmatimonadales bacterium]|jgi:cobalt-zinc-cadmium efflux system outer membrane protein|nr:TolC family protein [Gemmatimonadales bacterium]